MKTRRAHLQCHVWQHVRVANNPMFESTTLGWSREANGELMPVLTRVPLAPQSALQLAHIFLEVHQLCIVDNHAKPELRCTYMLFRCLEYSNMNVIFGCMFILNLLTIQFWTKSMKQ